MNLLLLPLLLAGAPAGPLIENFECGPEKWGFTKLFARLAIDRCIDAVQDGANLCCKAHDLCFDAHTQTGYTRQYCDARFCNCLQDVSDRTKNYECTHPLDSFCHLARHLGESAYEDAKPNKHLGAFGDFHDYTPLGLNMKKLVQTCEYSKVIAVHCHNTVHTCMQSDHARMKRIEMVAEEGIVEHPYQDCHTMMYHCLQMIVDNEPEPTCVELAQRYAKEVNIYTELDENTHGKAIIEAYPIPVSRLLKQCNESNAAILPCLTSFQVCSSSAPNRQEKQEHFSKIRQIKVVCHKELSACIGEATKAETSEECVEARNVAIGSIRSTELKTDPKWYDEGIAFVATYVETFNHKVDQAKNAVKDFFKSIFG